MLNDTLKTIAGRYSCRAFTDEIPTGTELNAIATAAISAPSAMNKQPWRVLVVKNQDLILEMESEGMKILASNEDQSMYNRISERGGSMFYHAPTMIMVAISREESTSAELDCGIVCQNIAIAATSLGLGNVICGMAGLAFSGNKKDEFKKKLGFPNGYEFGMSVLIGHAEGSAEPHVPDESKIQIID